MSARRAATLSSIALTALLAVVIAACSSGGASGGTAGGKLTVSEAWVRVPASPDTTAAYLTIVNGTTADDSLVGVSTTAATSASLHRTTTDSSGMTGMQMTDSVHVPAGGTVSLAPGGFHIMLMGLTGDLKAGATIELVLTFEHAGVVKVTAEVRAS